MLTQTHASQIEDTSGGGELTFHSIFSRQSDSSAAQLASAVAGVENTLTVVEIGALTLYHKNADSIAFHMPRQVLAWQNPASLALFAGVLQPKSKFDSTFYNLTTGFSAQEAPSETDKNIEFTLALNSKGGSYAMPNFSILQMNNQYQWTADGPSPAVNPWYTHLDSGFAPLNGEYSGYSNILAYTYSSGDGLLQSFFQGDFSTSPFNSTEEKWNTRITIHSFEVYSVRTNSIIPEPASGSGFLAGLILYAGIFRRRK